MLSIKTKKTYVHKKCVHGKRFARCVECGGQGLCIHSIPKETCAICDGASICEHGINRRVCKVCQGSHFCIHKKRKHRCKLCNGSELCKSTYCFSTANKYYNGYCLRCTIFLFPHIKTRKNMQSKESNVVENIKNRFTDITLILDSVVKDGCSLKRPDVCIDLGSHVIIVEIDENQHQHYTCENRRTMQLSEDFGFRNVIFIRFNPDSYTKNGILIESCWKRSKKIGAWKVDKKKYNEWYNRIEDLLNTIEYWIYVEPDKLVTIVKKYYSEQ